MPYELMITRADNQLTVAERPISQEEWKAVASGDPDLTLSQKDYQDVVTARGTERQYAWIVKTDPQKGGLWYEGGAIVAYSPDAFLIKKMVAIANKLGARVIGEEDEVYNKAGEAQ